MTYAYTLGFNLVSEIAESMRRMSEQNDARDYKHFLINLDFPLEKGDEIPRDVRIAKKNNTESLKELALKYGSTYLHFPNIGVSQNTANFVRYVNIGNDDFVVSVEPDEIQNEGGWIRSQTEVLQKDEILGYVAPILVDAIPFIENNPNAPIENIAGHDVYIVNGNMNYGNVAYSGKFINKMGGIPFPPSMPVYGGLEFSLKQHLDKHKMRWGLMKDYTTTHEQVVVPLYREWKNYLILENPNQKQISFEEWLVLKKWGKI